MGRPGASFDVPALESDRLELVALSDEHRAGMFELWSSPEVCRFAGPAVDANGAPVTLPAPTMSESDKILGFWLRRREEGTGFRWAILLKPSRTFIGACGFNSLGPRSEYAYHLHPDHWGRGLMFEASELALSWLRSRGGCDVCEVFVEPENVRSVGLATRLGFRPAGVSSHGIERFELEIEGIER